MARTQTLTFEELTHLRRKIEAAFSFNHPGKEAIHHVSYKEAYEDLRSDILAFSPEATSSVSLNRLRKLFYYTNPAVCKEGQLESTTFGKDFLAALEDYCSNAQKQPTAHLPNSDFTAPRKFPRWTIFTTILLACAASLAIWHATSEEKAWKENFDDTSLKGLQKQGWEVLDMDTAWLSKQKRPGSLTLFTLHGDYWVKPNESRIIKNMLVKKIESENFTVTIKVEDFLPYQSCQSTALFLLDDPIKRENYVRVDFHSYHNPPIPHSDCSVGLYHYCDGSIIGVYDALIEKSTLENGELKRGWLKFEVREGVLEIRYRINIEWGGMSTPFPARKLTFKPAYIGIASFQGWTRHDGITPWGADTIPAYIDYVDFRPIQ